MYWYRNHCLSDFHTRLLKSEVCQLVLTQNLHVGGSGIVYEQIRCKHNFEKKMDKIEKKMAKSGLWLSDKT